MSSPSVAVARCGPPVDRRIGARGRGSGYAQGSASLPSEPHAMASGHRRGPAGKCHEPIFQNETQPGAEERAIQKAPCPQTIIHWVIRLTIVRIDAARTVRGLPLEQAPFTNGLIWMIDLSIGLGAGKILAVLALDAHHHQLVSGAPTLRHVHCLGVAVADSWTGETIAELLKRLIAQMGRPAAYLKDRGSDLHKAAALLEV